ncbi:nucleotide-sugar transporter-domain-containing protein [Pavlovales sp. CCMP2436]|nr:nucleotide-sugar transporter-domain-containing protein [Pavlovales sp. CCMP2436]|mmetsp:Transcript_43898/g.108612  ORF Transcript_43898/g.108612 Transcript_43898/m.108612 type:complete len:343 (-) Transcript_43898:204-1232(-)
MLTVSQLPYFLATTVLMTLSPILVMLSQNTQGGLDYSIPSTTLLTEAIKIGISLAMLLPEPSDTRTVAWSSVAHYVIPAVIYFVNNNLTFLILTHVHPTTFQLISQLKILFTGLLFRWVLKRHLHLHQYFAIALVACGTAASQIPSCETADPKLGLHTPFYGFLLMVVSCFLSALGGIYSEKLLKGKMSDSIHWQNTQLYAWGILFNALGTLIHDPQVLAQGFFTGYNKWTWLVIANNALNGLCISALLKFSDNIMRVFAHATAILLSMLWDLLIFKVVPTPQVIVAFAVISISMVQYNTATPLPAAARLAAKSGPFVISDDESDMAEESGLLAHRQTPGRS